MCSNFGLNLRRYNGHRTRWFRRDFKRIFESNAHVAVWISTRTQSVRDNISQTNDTLHALYRFPHSFSLPLKKTVRRQNFPLYTFRNFVNILRDLNSPPGCKLVPRSSWMLHSADWSLFTGVSGRFFCPFTKGQAVNKRGKKCWVKLWKRPVWKLFIPNVSVPSTFGRQCPHSRDNVDGVLCRCGLFLSLVSFVQGRPWSNILPRYNPPDLVYWLRSMSALFVIQLDVYSSCGAPTSPD